jgi:CheY-like chemotaxis protein/HPt (histidine-containing phosphotransfer) domain-containing protein
MRADSAATPDEALEKYDEAAGSDDPFRLVLLDSDLPGSDGFALAQQIAGGAGPHAPVLMMLTPGNRPGSISQCEQLGQARYVLKPVKQSELFDAIAAALGVANRQAAESGPESPLAARPLDILLAEDSAVNQKLVCGLLVRQGHRVTAVGNGREAMAAVETGRFDLLLLDVQMPEIDGLQVAAAIRGREQQNGGHLPIIAMTAHAMPGDREACLRAGMDGYVSKPIRLRALVESIDAALSRNKPAPEPAPGAPPLDDDSDSPLDWSKATASVQGDERLLRTVAQAFLAESPRLLASMRRALGQNDSAAMRTAAHTLKSSLNYLGASRAFELASRLEAEARDGIENNTSETLAGLENQIEQIAAQLSRFVESGRAENNQLLEGGSR